MFVSTFNKNQLKASFIKEQNQLIENAVSEICERRKIQELISSGDIRFSLDVDAYKKFEKENAEYVSFSKVVIDLIKTKGFTPKEFYRRAHIDRKLFSKLKTDYCYQPNKNTAIKICFALDLTYDDAEKLLNKSGYALKKWDSFDLAIIYCFENEITDIDIVNEILIKLGENTL